VVYIKICTIIPLLYAAVFVDITVQHVFGYQDVSVTIVVGVP
jgi:hypothetical protein